MAAVFVVTDSTICSMPSIVAVPHQHRQTGALAMGDREQR